MLDDPTALILAGGLCGFGLWQGLCGEVPKEQRRRRKISSAPLPLTTEMLSPSARTAGLANIERPAWTTVVVLILTLACLLSAQWASVERSLLTSSPPVARPRQAQLNYTKVAALLETRRLPINVPIISHYLFTIPPDWPVRLFVTPEIESDLLGSRKVRDEVASGRLNITMIPEWAGWIHDWDTLTHFMLKPWYWHQYPAETEWMYFFQTDSVMCAAANTTLDDWLGYSWVGRPEAWSTHDGHIGGNGGASMRRISDLKNLTSDAAYMREINSRVNVDAEDLIFTVGLRERLKATSVFPLDRDQHEFSCSEIGAQTATDVRSLIVHGECVIQWEIDEYCPEVTILERYMHQIKPHKVLTQDEYLRKHTKDGVQIKQYQDGKYIGPR